MTKLCVRKSDHAVFRPSYPDDYSEGKALLDLMSGRDCYYFRRVELRPLSWFPWVKRWRDTGEVWEPRSGDFTVVEDRQARDIHLMEGLYR